MSRRKLTVGQQIASGYAAVIAIMVLLSVVGLRANRRFMNSTQEVAHTYQVLSRLDSLPFLMRSAEMAVRGFVLSGQDSYLEPCLQADPNVHKAIDELNALLADSPEQQRRLAAIRPGIDTRLEGMRTVIAARREHGFEAAQQLVLSAKTQHLSDEL